ncbi:MAG: GTPase HflX [Elusimicrobiota bacterium]|nr:GTPase HflX [Elusimicrobiota bacterium]
MEKVIIIGIKHPGITSKEMNNSLDELKQLVYTAGGEVEAEIMQKRDKFDPAYLIGKGKAQEIAQECSLKKVKTVIFDENLTPAQQRNLEEVINAKIIDRTRLILDIFARRARTSEAELQIELAQMIYFLPRLTQHGIWLDGQVGGIGTRGPGERKLEYDRRRIRKRITQFKHKIETIRMHREVQRSQRITTGIPVIALIGYTNVGKSTLFNKIVNMFKTVEKNPVYADNKLFATLDPTTRRIELPNKRPVLLTDTVGFIRKLPPELVTSFRATLEEICLASCLIHLIDVTNTDFSRQEKIVLETLTELNADKIPIIRVYNKIDLLPEKALSKLVARNNAMLISAKTGDGVKKLLEKINESLSETKVTVNISLPYENQKLLSYIYSNSEVLDRSYNKDKIKLKLKLDLPVWQKIHTKKKPY